MIIFDKLLLSQQEIWDMVALTPEQTAYLDRLLLQPPAAWPAELKLTATNACRIAQESSYQVIRGIATAWILDGANRVMTLPEIAALQPDIDLRPSKS